LASVAAVVFVALLGSAYYLWTRADWLSAPEPNRPKPAATVAAEGRLALPLPEGLVEVALPSRRLTTLVGLGPNASVTAARWAPDGQSIAYALYHVREGDGGASSEILVRASDGATRVVAERQRAGDNLENPAWSPDGGSIYFTSSRVVNDRLVRQIERVDLAGGTRSAVAEGINPEISPDGKTLVYVRTDRLGERLLARAANGGDERELIGPGNFSVIGPARFSPDGATLAIPAAAPTTAAGFDLGRLLVGVAHAHGDPWEVYLMPMQGGQPRRVSDLAEDEMTLAWSPNGSQLAAFASRGLYLIRPDGHTTYALDRGGYAGLDWTR
jgi:Tol biopolymer transport system component